MKSGNLKFLETSGPLQACNGTGLPFTDLVYEIPEDGTHVPKHVKGEGPHGCVCHSAFFLVLYMDIRNKMRRKNNFKVIIRLCLLFYYPLTCTSHGAFPYPY
jgi:hypothetical protein